MGRDTSRVLVTGGAGFLGSHLTRALVSAGHSVRVLDDFSTGKRERLASLPVDVLQADVRNPAAVRRAMDGAHIVFHLAGTRVPLDGRDSPLWRAEEINVGGALNVLDAARVTKPRRIVFGGTGEVYGRAAAYLLHEEIAPVPAIPEAVQAFAVEQYARLFFETYHVPSVVLRLFQCFGPGEPTEGVALVPRMCQAILANSAPVVEGEPRLTRDLVFVDNAIAALGAAASVTGIEGNVYNIASGEAASIAHVWATLVEVAGKKRAAMEPTYLAARYWEQTNVRVSIARANRDLGYAPVVRLREGLRRTLEHNRHEYGTQSNAWFSPPGTMVAPSAPERVTRPTPVPTLTPPTGVPAVQPPAQPMGASERSGASRIPPPPPVPRHLGATPIPGALPSPHTTATPSQSQPAAVARTPADRRWPPTREPYRRGWAPSATPPPIPAARAIPEETEVEMIEESDTDAPIVAQGWPAPGGAH